MSQRLLNSGAVYRKYKTSAEISAGGKEYTKDVGSGNKLGIDDQSQLFISKVKSLIVAMTQLKS
jgi:hypothetical protein